MPNAITGEVIREAVNLVSNNVENEQVSSMDLAKVIGYGAAYSDAPRRLLEDSTKFGFLILIFLLGRISAEEDWEI